LSSLSCNYVFEGPKKDMEIRCNELADAASDKDGDTCAEAGDQEPVQTPLEIPIQVKSQGNAKKGRKRRRLEHVLSQVSTSGEQEEDGINDSVQLTDWEALHSAAQEKVNELKLKLSRVRRK